MKAIQKEMDAVQMDAFYEIGADGGAPMANLFAKTAAAKLPAVKEYLQEVLERGEEKAIIFAHHQIMLDEIEDLLKKYLPADGHRHIRIDGKTPQAKRPVLVKDFQEDLQ